MASKDVEIDVIIETRDALVWLDVLKFRPSFVGNLLGRIKDHVFEDTLKSFKVGDRPGLGRDSIVDPVELPGLMEGGQHVPVQLGEVIVSRSSFRVVASPEGGN